jgi:hypothetical protein
MNWNAYPTHKKKRIDLYCHQQGDKPEFYITNRNAVEPKAFIRVQVVDLINDKLIFPGFSGQLFFIMHRQ